MSDDESRLRKVPVLRELFVQWREARGYSAAGAFQKPFSRDWQKLLQDAGLTSAEARREADRDARMLESLGLISLKTVRYRAYQIERIAVPLDAELRLRTVFADQMPPRPDERFDPSSVTWAPEMRFVETTKTSVAPEDLIRLNEFFVNAGNKGRFVPLKERSLEIFGDEKRLDALRGTALFQVGLYLDMLRCFVVAEPLGWQRGPNEKGPLLVIENAATWDSYCRWNREHGFFSAVVYGCGNRFADSVSRLADIFSEIGGSRRVFYFGDLDPRGLHIPQLASAYAMSQDLRLPPIEPHSWSYRQLLLLGDGKEMPWIGEPISRCECEWLRELTNAAWAVLSLGKRLPQEHVGWTFLQQQRDAFA